MPIERNCPHCGKRISDWVFPRPYVTLAEAAFIMGGGVTEQTVRGWMDRGAFTRYKAGNGGVRLDQDEVVAFIARQDWRKTKRADAEMCKGADPLSLTTREIGQQRPYWVPPPLKLHHERFSASNSSADLDKKSRLRRDARRLRGLWYNY